MKDVDYTITDRIAHIRFQRPELGNAVRPQSCIELTNIARRISENSDIGAIVISGEGKIFCSGGDIKAFAAADHLGDFVYDMATAFHNAIETFDRIDAPIIAAVQGNVAGAGVSLVASFDIVVAAKDASFTMGYGAIGYTPDGSSSYYLSRAIGLKRALDLALTNRTIDATTAEDWGLVSRLAEPDNVLDDAMALAKQLTARETEVLGATKRLLREGTERTLREAMARETEQVAWAATRPATAEKLQAFLNRKRSGSTS